MGVAVSFRYVTFAEDPIKHLTIVCPPPAVLGVQLSASVARMTRTMMLEVLQEDYIRTARAKGLRELQVIVRHALKNALIPVVTILGLQVTFLIGGSVITEQIFALPGLGSLLLEAIGSRDYPIVQGIVVVGGGAGDAHEPPRGSLVRLPRSAGAALVSGGKDEASWLR